LWGAIDLIAVALTLANLWCYGYPRSLSGPVLGVLCNVPWLALCWHQSLFWFGAMNVIMVFIHIRNGWLIGSSSKQRPSYGGDTAWHD